MVETRDDKELQERYKWFKGLRQSTISLSEISTHIRSIADDNEVLLGIADELDIVAQNVFDNTTNANVHVISVKEGKL